MIYNQSGFWTLLKITFETAKIQKKRNKDFVVLFFILKFLKLLENVK